MNTGERTELSAGADVPHTHGAVGAERREPPAVRVEPSREHAAAVRAEHVHGIAGGGVPEPCGAVGASGREELPVRAVRRREHLPFVPVSVTSCSPVRASRMLASSLEVGGDEAGPIGANDRI